MDGSRWMEKITFDWLMRNKNKSREELPGYEPMDIVGNAQVGGASPSTGVNMGMDVDGLSKEIGLIEKWISEIKEDVEEKLSREELLSIDYDGSYYDDVHGGSCRRTQ